MSSRPLRAMWLLNHTTARKFEIPMLKRIGVREVFLPKITPSDLEFRSTSIDWSEDDDLTIPKEDLSMLNSVNWYDDPGVDIWKVANRHFDIAFFIALNGEFFKSISHHFKGAKIWRAYGLAKATRYHDVLTLLTGRGRPLWSPRVAKNFWLGQAYPHLSEIEPAYLAERSIFFPAGLADTDVKDEWIGEDKRIFFVCPNLSASEYYQEVYQMFRQTFSELPYVVAGAQPVKTLDDHLLNYVSSEQHQRNMRQYAVMYYHSAEPNHVHYHPFEAVHAGMPLVYMAGSLLDRLGGIDLPGRCRSPEEARTKVKRVLEGDHRLIEAIRSSQRRLLEPMKAENCESSWRAGLQTILRKMKDGETVALGEKKKRVAVIVPVGYRGGTLRGAKLLARAIEIGSRQSGSPAEVVFAHLDDPVCYSDEEFSDLPESIERRPYRWRSISQKEATRACVYSGIEGHLSAAAYSVPDDGMNQFMDCDLWIIISDRLNLPLLPVRPYLLMVYDYLQRYVPFLDDATTQQFISWAHAAEAVMVTTTFTAGDARQFAGIPGKKVKTVPLLAPEFSTDLQSNRNDKSPSYFLWTTNLAFHKNHENALKALRLYYEEHNGSLECHVTGVGTREIFKQDFPHLLAARKIRRSSGPIKDNLKIEGELPDQGYRRKLREAAFLWHPAKMDNGSFSVIEAASLGVPALSSDYPAMREIDHQFQLNLTWANPNDPTDMATKLKQMETDMEAARGRLPSAEVFSRQSVDRLAGEYWKVIREYL